LSKLGTVSTESATDFENAQIFCLSEAGGGGNVPFLFVTMRFDEFKKLA
jgi:hypothetical protein